MPKVFFKVGKMNDPIELKSLKGQPDPNQWALVLHILGEGGVLFFHNTANED